MKKRVIVGIFFVFVILLIIFFGLREELRLLFQDENARGLLPRSGGEEDIVEERDDVGPRDVREDARETADSQEGMQREGTQKAGSLFGGVDGGVDGGVASSSTCTLIRPGNIPDVSCSVRFIREREVSLIIVNQLGQDIVANLQLVRCSPGENVASVANNQGRDFVFSCDNTGRSEFEEDLTVTYTINGQRVRVYGFVKGPVSL